MWKREITAPNATPIPGWVPKPPNGTRALKSDKDVVPITATAKNGGWNGGTWMPEGIGYGARNHGWGERAAAAWYEANGYQSNENYRVNPCANTNGTMVLLIITLFELAVLTFRCGRSRFKAFYGLAAGFAALMAAGMFIKLSGVTNSVDIAFVFDALSAALYPFLWVELFSLVKPATDGKPGFSWSWTYLGFTLTVMAVLSGIDQVNTSSILIVPLLEEVFMVGRPLYFLVKNKPPSRSRPTASMSGEDRKAEGERSVPGMLCAMVSFVFQLGSLFPVAITTGSTMSYCKDYVSMMYAFQIINLSPFCLEWFTETIVWSFSDQTEEHEARTSSNSMELQSPPAYEESEDRENQEATTQLLHKDVESGR